jgi:hypothetical protein
MKICKRFAVATRRLTLRTFARPTVRNVSIKVFPTVVDTVLHTHDLRQSIAGTAELESALLMYEVALITTSMTTKNLFKNKSSSRDP